MTTLILTRATTERILSVLDATDGLALPGRNAAESCRFALSETDDSEVVIELNAYETEATLAALVARV